MTSLAGDSIPHKNFLAKNFTYCSPGGMAVSRESLVLHQQFYWMKVGPSAKLSSLCSSRNSL